MPVSTRLSIATHSLDDIKERLSELPDTDEVNAARARLRDLRFELNAQSITFVETGERSGLVREVLAFHLEVLAMHRRARGWP